MELLHPSLIISSISICGSSMRKKNKHQHQQQRRRRRPLLEHLHHNNNNNNLSYPKAYPTPLLINHTPKTQTRDQLLDQVLIDLQSSIGRGVAIEPSIFSSLLETCFQLRSLDHGIRVRRLIPPNLLHRSADLSSKLLRLYASCGLVEEAHHIFDQMPQRHRNRTAFAWNSLISGYTELGLYEDAMALYYQMEEEGVQPDQFTFPRVLKACAGLGSIGIGEAVHRHVVRSGCAADPFVLNALVDMYAKCGDIVKARRIFDKITCRDPITWNSMLTGYAWHGLFAEALDVCREMLRSGVEPNSIAISTILVGPLSSKLGSQIHSWVLRRGLERRLSVGNALISMYSEHNCSEGARKIFESMPEKDIASWNAIICAHRRDQKALSIFQRMENLGILPDRVTFVSLLSACANMGLVEEGKELFTKMEEKYKMEPGIEHYGCMANLLGRSGLVDEAYELVLKRMPFDGGPTVWGALLFACSVHHGHVSVGEVAAERLFELEADNEHNFELLMKIYRRAGRWEEVEKVRRLMRERGLGS